MAFIDVEGLTKRYGESVYALRQVSLSVEKGEWISVMGPSGSGKSTLLNILGCLDAPTAGRVIVEDENLAEFSAAERARFRAEKVGLVFQQYHLVPYLTAVENVMLAQYFHSMSDEEEAADALRRVGLRDRLHHLPSQLSGGEQQRVCIARALINQPNLILADEPTGNLDSHTGEEILALLNDLQRKLGSTVLLVTHDSGVARSAPRRVGLRDARIVEDVRQ